MQRIVIIVFLGFLSLYFYACKPMDQISSKSYEGGEYETESGIKYTIHKAGIGERAVAGKMVSVDYVGRLEDGTEFDNSYDRGKAFTFQLGEGQVIPGFDEGIALLNVGDSATLTIPSHMAYGKRQVGKYIKPYSTLVFDIVLLKVFDPVK